MCDPIHWQFFVFLEWLGWARAGLVTGDTSKLPTGGSNPMTFGSLLLVPMVCISREVESGAGSRDQTQVLWCGMTGLNICSGASVWKWIFWGAGVVVQRLRHLHPMWQCLGLSPGSALHSGFLLKSILGGSRWVPVAHPGDPHGSPSSMLCLGICGVMGVSLCLFLSIE